ncbi:MAG: M56 family metallopeptidase [Terriglobales bacterium]
MLLWLLGGIIAAERLRRRAHPLPLLASVPVLESVEIRTPAAIGVWRQAIVLPSEWRGWSGEWLGAVLAHEQAHLERGDPLRLRLAYLHQAVFWFSPLGWWFPRKLAAMAEAASDAAALGTGIRPSEYAGLLLEMLRAGGGAGRVHWQGAAMAGRKSARNSERRLQRILDCRVWDRNKEETMSNQRRWSYGLAAGLIPLALLAAAVRPQVRAAGAAQGAEVAAPGQGGVQYALLVNPETRPRPVQGACEYTSYDGWAYVAFGEGCTPAAGRADFAVTISAGAATFNDHGRVRHFSGNTAATAVQMFRGLDVNNAKQRFLQLQEMDARVQLERSSATRREAEDRIAALGSQAALMQERASSIAPTSNAHRNLVAEAAALGRRAQQAQASEASSSDDAALSALRARSADLQRQLDGLRLEASGEVRHLERGLRTLAAALPRQ